MGYAVSVALGFLAAALVARALSAQAPVPPSVARAVRIAAGLGGVVGAYVFELPADLLGLAPPTPDGLARLGGRTVLGGLLGGWVAVELVKWRRGFRESTGDAFAAPLAVAFTFGRFGCVLAGCCPGRAIASDSPLAAVSHLLHRAPRFPAASVEASFHASAALVLVVLASRRLLRGYHFGLYMLAYAATRFLLEFARDVPRPFGGLSYYQLLATVLFAAAAMNLTASARRARARRALAPDTAC